MVYFVFLSGGCMRYRFNAETMDFEVDSTGLEAGDDWCRTQLKAVRVGRRVLARSHQELYRRIADLERSLSANRPGAADLSAAPILESARAR